MLRKLILSISLIYIYLNEVIGKKTKKDKCYVLALEGGGDKGAYQAGALKGLVDNIPNQEHEWDVVTGISAGSLNAVALSIFEVGDEKVAADYIVESWRSIKGKGDIYQNWWGGPLEGLFFKTGIYDVTPSRKKFESIVKDKEMKRKFVCGAVNFVTGQFETWDEETLYREEYEDAILSSGAYPVVFPVNEFRNNTYMDGGVKISVNIVSGVNKCEDMGYTEENIVIDVILLNSKILPEQDPKGVHPLGVLTRVFEIYGYDNAMRDLEYSKIFFTKAKFRYIIAPTMKLPSGSIPLTFNHDQIEKMINFGIADAKKVIAMGEGKNYDHLLNQYKEDRMNLVGRKRKTQPKESPKTTTEEEIIFLQ